jgi:hypothetical protein
VIKKTTKTLPLIEKLKPRVAIFPLSTTLGGKKQTNKRMLGVYKERVKTTKTKTEDMDNTVKVR